VCLGSRDVVQSAKREARGLCPRIGSAVVVVHSAKGGVADVILGARVSNWNGHREQAATGASSRGVNYSRRARAKFPSVSVTRRD
jgi:hypothetical protein